MESRFNAVKKDFYFPLCNKCKHYIAGVTCRAFPGGIPIDILTGRHEHTKPYEGDGGIRFEEKEE